MFGIPVGSDQAAIVSRLPLNSERAKFLAALQVIVWEELPMANKTALECADDFLRKVTGINLPLGGKILIGCGDFRQVAPVVVGGGPTAVLDASVRSSNLWPRFQIVNLVEPMRNACYPTFLRFVD